MTSPSSTYSASNVEATLRSMLRAMGFDPDDPAIADTPARVARSWAERLGGYDVDPVPLLGVCFDAGEPDSADDAGVVLLRGIGFHSSCEHHLLPFSGVAHVAYIPDGNGVVGLSKLARLVDCFARRLQLQERLGNQIADALDAELSPRGVAVVIEGKHGCMICRGVRQQTAVMVTSALRGVYRQDPAARAELFSMIALGGPTL